MDAPEGPGWLHPSPFFFGNGLFGAEFPPNSGIYLRITSQLPSKPGIFSSRFFGLIHVDFHSSWIQIRVGFRDLQSFFPPGFPLICPFSTHPSSQQDSLWIFLPPAGFVWELLFPALILIPPSSHLIPGIPCSFPSIRWNIPSSGIQLESRRTPGKPPGKQQEGLKKTWNGAGSTPS